MPTIRTRPEDLPTGLLLAGAGGFLDAYAFVGRGGVFANAQTGNIVLLAVAAGERHWPAALLHVPPILAFMLGVAVAETLARPRPAGSYGVRPASCWSPRSSFCYRRRATPTGAGSGRDRSHRIRVGAASLDVPVAAGHRLQHDALTTSNLRTLVAKAYLWCADHDVTARRQAARIGAVVAGFGVGAAVGALCTHFFGPRAVWVAAAMLVLALAAIVMETVTLSRRKQ